MRTRWLAAVCMSIAAQAFADEQLDRGFARDVLIVIASRHACYRFDIYLALDSAQQRRGLMHVRQLPEAAGMLFVYEDEDYHSMWMRNTYIPLDIAFARGDGVIVNIARNTEPLSLKSIRSAAPVTYVLELNAGVSDHLFIDAGSRIVWGPMFDENRFDEQ